MSLSSFALILHNRSNEAKNAAFVYIKYAIFGEVLIFFGKIGIDQLWLRITNVVFHKPFFLLIL
jgi:hypothetical protein